MAGEFSATDLVKALRKQVTILEDDLRARVDGAEVDSCQPGVGERWKAEHTAALAAQRTAASWQAWRDERVTQAAVAWVLLTVFARYCEDHVLVSKTWIGGPNADARQQALDARRAYFTAHPEHTDREWLESIIEHFAKMEATRGLVDAYSPLHQVAPSGDAARGLLEFWWDKDASGEPLWSFVDVDTRFLGDVYQDLSEFAKKTYALLQTPEFVEEFILDQTLEPALAERPLDGFTVIDPTCGSGHFLLGAFHRLLERWQREAPALGDRVLVGKALASVYGVDINPFAVAIARFRLVVAALDASGDKSIEKLIDIELNLAAGDSLLWGARQQAISDDLWSTGQEQMAYATENADALKEILQREHDVVVGNPPYITVTDSMLNSTYRSLYPHIFKQVTLTVPFMELFFSLAKQGGSHSPSGWVGKITSSAFMKREFGIKIVEKFLPSKDLRIVIDSDPAWIPGHNSEGTPTVILVGRGGLPVRDTVRAVMSKGRREGPNSGSDGEGPFWRSLVDHIADSAFDDEWLTVAVLNREVLRKHPWSLAGGGAGDLVAALEAVGRPLSKMISTPVGRAIRAGADNVFLRPVRLARTGRLNHADFRHLVLGEAVRDWCEGGGTLIYYPYEYGTDDLRTTEAPPELWPWRTLLAERGTFQGNMEDAGSKWWAYMQHTSSAYKTELSITFAEVASHNHFVLDRGGNVFKQTAPVIKLPVGSGVDDHLKLLGVLNSSVACFWLRHKCKPKGGAADHVWSRTYQFNGSTIQKLPVPSNFSLDRSGKLDSLARELAAQTPELLVQNSLPTPALFLAARERFEQIRSLLIALQEELDWEYYRLYGLIGEDLTFAGELPALVLGERAFEILLARAAESGERTAWFERHHSTPITEIPAHLPGGYRDLLQRRLDVIASNPSISLLEKPEYKRRWAIDPWDKLVTEALRDWLLDRVENKDLWFDDGHPTPRSVAQLADRLDRDEDFRNVLRLWAGSPDVSTSASLGKLLDEEGVPYLAAWRYESAGLIKREAWENTWVLQWREDNGETLDAPIPVPPEYKAADFGKSWYWSKRGKLDVPKERFVSYPGANRDNDDSQLLGWAGWDHAQQAFALAGLIDARIGDDGWDQAAPDKLVPMLAGLAELLPWVRQWHGEIDPEYGTSDADDIAEVLRSHSADLGVTADDLTAWRPPAATRGRRTSKKENSPA